MIYKMSKDAMRERISEALASNDQELIRRRVAVCLWGLDKVRDGARLANELIDEMQLEKYGAKRSEIS